MRGILLPILCQVGLLAGGRLFADVVVLKDGREISGTVESGNTQELHLKVNDQSQTIDIHDLRAIQFGPSPTAPPPAKAAATSPAATEHAPGQPDSLLLKDRTRVSGKWWSIDASNVHFLVNNQLQHFPRADVSAVNLGVETPESTSGTSSQQTPTPVQATVSASQAAPPPALTRPSPTQSAQPPTLERPSAGKTPPTLTRPPTQSAQPPTLERPSAGTPPPTSTRPSSTQSPQSPTLERSSASTPPGSPARGLSQPEEIGAVYFWNGKDLTPLESNQAVPRGRGSNQYWEMPGPQSRVRLKEAPSLVFILRLQRGVDPASYSLFSLVTVDGARRTRSQSGHRGALVTWPFKIETNDESGYITYALTVRDLPSGEYSFSPSSSNSGYCFGVDE